MTLFATPSEHKEALTVLFLCLTWYTISASNNVVGKTVLSQFPYPMTITMVQLASITLYSAVTFDFIGIRRVTSTTLPWRTHFKILIPLAIGKFIGSVFTHVSIWKVPVSYAHTVKATMPLFTVVLSRVIFGEKQTCQVYSSLAPIIVGVVIATKTELSFDLIGLLSALGATAQYSLQNIFSKKVLHDSGVHHLRLLQILGRLSLVLFTPVWLYFDLGHLMTETQLLKEGQIVFLLVIDGALNWLQNIVAFSVMSVTTSLTYGVASATKRLFIIAASLLVLGNPVTMLNLFGMGLSVLGVLFYNKAKLDARRAEKSRSILPMSSSDLATLLPNHRSSSNSSMANGHAISQNNNNNNKLMNFI